MAKSRTVKDVDRGARRLLELVKGAGAKALVVGVYGDDAAKSAEGGHGLTVGEVAAIAEFSPMQAGGPRSWLRATLDQEAHGLVTGLGKLYQKVVAGEMTADEALKLTGLAMVGKIQKRIADGIAPALTPKYLAEKLDAHPGATTPLIASGQFRGSITSSVVDAKELG